MTAEIVRHGKGIAQVFAGPEDDLLRSAMEVLVKLLMEAEERARVAAGPHERSEDRTTWRNRYRRQGWETRMGPLLLQIPRLREGSYCFLEPRKRSERALVRPCRRRTCSGSRRGACWCRRSAARGSTGARCKELDEEAQAFRGRPLEGEVPYVWLDAVYEKAR